MTANKKDKKTTKKNNFPGEMLQEPENFEMLAQLIDSSPDGIVVHNGGEIVFVNSTFVFLLGAKSPKDFIGKQITDFVHQDSCYMFSKNITQSFQNNVCIPSQEAKFKKLDGSFIDVDVSSRGVIYKGSFACQVAIRDITSQKKQRELQKEREFRFEKMSEFIDDVFWITRWSDKKTIFASHAFEKIWGIKLADLYKDPMTWSKSIHPDDQEQALETFKSLQKKDVYDQKYRIIRPDGEVRWIRDRGYPVRSDNGKIEQVVGVASDITNQEKMDRALNDSKKHYESLFDLMVDPTVIIDSKGVFLNVTERVKEVSGYSKDDLIGKNFSQTNILSDKSKLLVKKNLALRLKGKVVPPYEVVVNRKSGGSRPFELNAVKITYQGEPAIMVSFRDVVKRKEAEVKLLRREKVLKSLNLAAEKFLRQSSFEEDVETLLSSIGQASGACRAYIFKNQDSPNGPIITDHIYEWTAKGVKSQIDNPDLKSLNLGKNGFERWVKHLAAKGIIAGSVETFPESEKALLKSQNIKSLVVVPIFSQEKWWGFLGFDDTKVKREWEIVEIETLKTLADLIGAALDRRSIEQKLELSSRFMQDVLFASADFIWEVDKDGRYTSIMGKVENILGYTSEEMLGKTPFDFLHSEDKARVQKEFAKILAKKGDIKSLENKNLAKDGSVVFLQTSGVPIFNKKGEVIGYRGVDKDITKRKEVEQNLKQKLEEMEEMNNLMVGRELKMTELKEKIASLEMKLRASQKNK